MMLWKGDGGFRRYLGRQPDQVELCSQRGVVDVFLQLHQSDTCGG